MKSDNYKNSKVDYSLPPISDKAPEFLFPDYETTSLRNKIKLYIYEDSTQPLVNVRFLSPCGSSMESIEGLAAFTSQMMTRGTSNRNAVLLAEETDHIGASLSATALKDYSSLSMVFLSEFSEKALDIFLDCIFNPVFDEAEILRQKDKQTAFIKQEMSDPGYLASVAFNSTLFRGHPYAGRNIGSVESIGKIDRNACLDWYENSIMNTMPIIVVSGNIQKDLINSLCRALEEWPGKGVQNIIGKASRMDQALQISLINKQDSVQNSLKMGKLTIGRSHPDFPAMQMSNVIFGGYFQSRLNSLLREKKGFTYGVYSAVTSLKKAAVFSISTNVNEESSREAVDDMLSEMSNFSKEIISPEEFNPAYQYILGSFVRSLETHTRIAGMIQGIALNNLPGDYYDNFFKRIASLTAEDLLPVKEKYFRPENMVLSASGNLDALKTSFEGLGDIEICGL